MPPDTAEAILRVNTELVKTCGQYIQDIGYHARARSNVTTTNRTEWFHEVMLEALHMVSQYNRQLDAVAEIYSRAATWEGVNDIVVHRCGEDLVW
jgi:hypothetical protein